VVPDLLAVRRRREPEEHRGVATREGACVGEHAPLDDSPLDRRGKGPTDESLNAPYLHWLSRRRGGALMPAFSAFRRPTQSIDQSPASERASEKEKKQRSGAKRTQHEHSTKTSRMISRKSTTGVTALLHARWERGGRQTNHCGSDALRSVPSLVGLHEADLSRVHVVRDGDRLREVETDEPETKGVDEARP
jgi:hypothetical protein